MTVAAPACNVCGGVTDQLASNRPLHKGRGPTLMICPDCVGSVTAAFSEEPPPAMSWQLIMADCAWCGRGGVAVASYGDYAICEDCASICRDCL